MVTLADIFDTLQKGSNPEEILGKIEKPDLPNCLYQFGTPYEAGRVLGIFSEKIGDGYDDIEHDVMDAISFEGDYPSFVNDFRRGIKEPYLKCSENPNYPKLCAYCNSCPYCTNNNHRHYMAEAAVIKYCFTDVKYLEQTKKYVSSMSVGKGVFETEILMLPFQRLLGLEGYSDHAVYLFRDFYEALCLGKDLKAVFVEYGYESDSADLLLDHFSSVISRSTMEYQDACIVIFGSSHSGIVGNSAVEPVTGLMDGEGSVSVYLLDKQSYPSFTSDMVSVGRLAIEPYRYNGSLGVLLCYVSYGAKTYYYLPMDYESETFRSFYKDIMCLERLQKITMFPYLLDLIFDGMLGENYNDSYYHDLYGAERMKNIYVISSRFASVDYSSPLNVVASIRFILEKYSFDYCEQMSGLVSSMSVYSKICSFMETHHLEMDELDIIGIEKKQRYQRSLGSQLARPNADGVVSLNSKLFEVAPDGALRFMPDDAVPAESKIVKVDISDGTADYVSAFLVAMAVVDGYSHIHGRVWSIEDSSISFVIDENYVGMAIDVLTCVLADTSKEVGCKVSTAVRIV